MYTSISALTYKGSIAEAILEAKRLKKLFLVYISGDNSKTTELEKTTWTDSRVVESLSKYCVVLHLHDGSTDAANFSVIYPQKSAPSIAAIGYNGVQVWQSDGFVSPGGLASNLEKAWFSLHLQDTTASVLTAALTSNKPDLSDSELLHLGSSEQAIRNSSSTGTSLTSGDKHGQSSKSNNQADFEAIEENSSEEKTFEEREINLEEEKISGPMNVSKSDDFEVGQSISTAEEASGPHSSPFIKPDNSAVDTASSSVKNSPSTGEKSIDHNKGLSGENSKTVRTELKDVPDRKAERTQADELDAGVRTNTLTDVLLNIKLPNGVSLQEKFSPMSTLRAVKEYVDRSEVRDIGSYDLAIPYPRKVFNDHDLSKSLLELGLLNRQALIVVSRQKAGIYDRGGPFSDRASSTINNDSSNSSNEDYFASVRRILSYFNPFSYLPTSSSSSESSQTGMWGYGPNQQALQGGSLRADKPYSSYSTSPSSSSVNKNDRKVSKPTYFGSNIHTLKHDEDDSRFGDQNPFWNGNSTQYGGNSDGK